MRCPGAVLIPCLALLAGALARPERGIAQTPGGGSILERLQRIQGGSAETAETPPAVPAVPLERAVDPERYRLFPGDQLHLGAWGEMTRSYSLTVTPEGDLIVPKAGLVRVVGLTLSEAESTAAAALRPHLGRSKVTLRLLAPGRFRIAVSGLVSRPGIYELTGTHRLSDLLEAAGGVRPGGSLRRVSAGEPDPESGSRRARQVDLYDWILRGETDSNPLLTPGLRVEVPPVEASARVRGPVNGRGPLLAAAVPPARVGDRPEEEADLQVEVLDGDDVATLLAHAGGLSDRAQPRATLRRAGEEPRVLDLSRDADRRVPVQAGDVLEVGYAARWVYVTGSVRSPGRFPFLSGLRARDYVAMAGGPTEVGRVSGWTIESPDGTRTKLDRSAEVPSGAVLRVPERPTYRLTAWLSPLSTATALIISVVALTR